MAEGRRFELLCPLGAAVFGTAGLPIAHPFRVERRVRIELTTAGLRPAAWPIGFRRLAGDPGFEPGTSGFGVRRSPDRACPPLVRLAGFEPALDRF